MNHWDLLELQATRDPQAIRHAYLKQLLTIHPQQHPNDFHRLREAYEDALDEILKDKIDDDFSLIDLYCHSEKDPAPISPTFCSAEVSADNQPAYIDTIQKFEIRATHYIEKLIERLSFENQQSAQHYLKELLQQPELNDIIMRAAFERLLQRCLTLIVPFPARLTTYAFDVFDWNAKLQHPHDCYLAAVKYLHDREQAYDRIYKLEELGAKRLTRPGKVARALLSNYHPYLFLRLALFKNNIDDAKTLLREIDKIPAKMLPFMLDPRTVQWWRKAVAKNRLFIKDYLAALSLALVATFFLTLFDKLSDWNSLKSNSQLALTILVLFVTVILYMLTFIHINRNNHDSIPGRPLLAPQSCPARRKRQSDYDDDDDDEYYEHASDRIDPRNRFYVITIIIMLSAFGLTLINNTEIMNAFAIIAYISMLYLFGPSMFFIINFAAMVLRLIFEEHAWFNELIFHSTLQIHTFCVFDLTATFILIHLLIQTTCRILKHPLGISDQRILNSTLYEFILLTAIFVAHIAILTL